eukprot:5560674-Amphidinium_carterae.1
MHTGVACNQLGAARADPKAEEWMAEDGPQCGGDIFAGTMVPAVRDHRALSTIVASPRHHFKPRRLQTTGVCLTP